MTLSSSVTDWMKRSIPRFSSVDPGSPSRSAFCEEEWARALAAPPPRAPCSRAKWNASRSAATVNRLKLSVRHPFMCSGGPRPHGPRLSPLCRRTR